MQCSHACRYDPAAAERESFVYRSETHAHTVVHAALNSKRMTAVSESLCCRCCCCLPRIADVYACYMLGVLVCPHVSNITETDALYSSYNSCHNCFIVRFITIVATATRILPGFGLNVRAFTRYYMFTFSPMRSLTKPGECLRRRSCPTGLGVFCDERLLDARTHTHTRVGHEDVNGCSGRSR